MTTRNEIERDLCGDARHDAAVWYAYLQRPDSDETAYLAFADWLEGDESRRDAYDAIERMHETLDAAGGALAQRLAERDGPMVLPFRRRPAIGWWGGAAAALAASVLAILAIRHPSAPPALRFETKPGETRTVTLADGTIVDLNRGTLLSVSFAAAGRRVRLEHGEAQFHVAADPARPFSVMAGKDEIRDIGTVFDVVRTPQGLTVGVSEGRVSVTLAGQERPAQLAAGDRLSVSADGPPAVSHGDPAASGSWTKGFLIYDNAPFSRVVADLNRYGALEIVQQGPDSGYMPISGILEIAGQEIMLERLGHMTPLLLDRSQQGRILVRAAPVSK